MNNGPGEDRATACQTNPVASGKIQESRRPNMLILHLPPDQTLSVLLENYNYTIAARYFAYNLLIVMTGILWGAALLAALMPASAAQGNHRVLKMDIGFLAASSGLGIIIAWIFLLALLHLFTANNVFIVFILTSAAAVFSLLFNRKKLQSICGPSHYLVSIVTLIFIVTLCAYQFSSASSWSLSDSTSYHVPYADYILKAQGLVIPQHLIYPYHSLNINIFYSLGLMLEHDLSYIQTMHALFATLTLLGIYQFCISTGQKPFIALALCIAFGHLFIIHYPRFSANVDHGSMFFILVTAFSLYLWQERRHHWLLAASAISFGMAIGSKYLMCVFAIPIAICIAMNTGIRHCWKPGLVFAGWTAAFGLWWYIRNWIITGNPVHPFATGLFGFYEWNELDIASQMKSVSIVRIPKTLGGFILMPYYAFENETLYNHGPAWVIAMLYATTLAAPLASRGLLLLLIFSWTYLVSWFFGSQDPRHLQPVIPLVFIFTGHIFQQIALKLFSRKTGLFSSQSYSRLSLIAMIPLLFWSAFLVQQQTVRQFYYEMAPSKVREKMLRSNPVYELFSEANSFFSTEETIYEFFLRDGRWFFRGNVVGTQFGPHGYENMVRATVNDGGKGVSPAKLQSILVSRYGASGVIVPSEKFMPYDPAEFDKYFELKFRNDLGSIYRFRQNP